MLLSRVNGKDDRVDNKPTSNFTIFPVRGGGGGGGSERKRQTIH